MGKIVLLGTKGSDSARLPPLRLTVANSSPISTHKKVATHSPQNKTHRPNTCP
jgi:hypothetical protein